MAFDASLGPVQEVTIHLHKLGSDWTKGDFKFENESRRAVIDIRQIEALTLYEGEGMVPTGVVLGMASGRSVLAVLTVEECEAWRSHYVFGGGNK